MNVNLPKLLIIAGLIVVAGGILLYYFPGMLKWLGKLPGDISINKGNTRIYFPIATMLIISLLLTILVNVIRKFF